MNSPRIAIDDSLRARIEGFKSSYALLSKERRDRLAEIESERQSLIAARAEIAAKLPVAVPGTVLSHCDAVEIAAARIRCDSIDARVAELAESAESLPPVPLDEAYSLIRESCCVWREKFPVLFAEAIQPFDPNPYTATGCLRLIAGMEIIQRIEQYYTSASSAAGPDRLFAILARVLEGRPYLGDDANSNPT